ncbi:capsule assembly Wzi family protein [Terriglobus albidus]|uniref:capsule assembly Wzi family protein n=1 Tax=Terriglobus albidus TaxID=1592106 RepID=UPI001FE66A06|nr:capsule assembly Wzi family protein [Terriglobus albidus]
MAIALVLLIMHPEIGTAQDNASVYESNQLGKDWARLDAYGSTNVPMDSWVYPALERLANLGLIPSQSISIRPWSRNECRRQLREAESNYLTISPGDRVMDEAEGLISDLKQEFDLAAETPAAEVESIYARVGTIAGPALSDGFHFGQTWRNDYGRPLGRGNSALAGFSVRANHGRFFFYDRQELQYGPGKTAITPALSELFNQLDMAPFGSAPVNPFPVSPATGAIVRQRPIELYAGFSFMGAQLSFGKQQLYWGPTQSGPFSFSSNAEPTYNLRLVSTRLRVVPFLNGAVTYRYDLVFGKLSGHKFPARPYFNGQKVELTFLNHLEVGFTRWSLLWGVGHPMTLGSLKRNLDSGVSTGATFLYGDRTDPGDRKGGFDLRLHVPGLEKYLTIYTDGFADDDPNPIDAPRRAAWSPGFYLSQLPYLRHMDLRFEVPSSMEMSEDEGGTRFFINNQYRDANTNKGFLLGNAVGRDARAYEVSTTYWQSGRTTYTALFRHVQGGRMLPGGQSITDVSFTGTFALSKEWSVTAFTQYERWLIPVLQPGPQRNGSAWITLTWNPKAESLLSRHK